MNINMHCVVNKLHTGTYLSLQHFSLTVCTFAARKRAVDMAWLTASPTPEPVEPLPQVAQQRLRKRCLQYLKSLQSCRRANVADPAPCERLETRVLECYAEVIFGMQSGNSTLHVS